MSRNGFTLIELLVVVLIIGILSAMAFPQYQKAAERARMSEAVMWLNTLAQAQQRMVMQGGSFADNYSLLDVAPKEASGSVYYTKGDPITGAGGNGFEISIYTTDALNNGYAEAVRHRDGQELEANYSLRRLYISENTTCSSSDEKGQAICANFCGIETPVSVCCNDGTSAVCYEPDNRPPPEEEEDDEEDDEEEE